MADEDKQVPQKEVVKEAIKEWLNEKVTAFGWFSIRSIGYVLFAGLMYAWFATHGFSIDGIQVK